MRLVARKGPTAPDSCAFFSIGLNFFQTTAAPWTDMAVIGRTWRWHASCIV